MKEKMHFSLSIDKELGEKFKYIANYEARSCNRQLARAIKMHINEFEKEHGAINIETQKNDA